MSSTSLKELLIERRILSRTQIEEAIRAAEGTGCTWLERLLYLGALDEEGLAGWISAVSKIAPCDARRLAAVRPSALAHVPLDVAFEHRAVPLSVDDDGYLHLAMVDPVDSAAIEELEFFAGMPIVRHVAPASHIAWALYQHYGVRTLLWPRPHAVARASSVARAS